MEQNTSTSPSADFKVVFERSNTAKLEPVTERAQLTPVQVLVEARSTLVSIGTELATLNGTHIGFKEGTKFLTYPITPGYSLAGVVIRTGDLATRFAEGDPVFCTGAHRSSVVLGPRESLVKIPNGISFDEATFAHLGAISLHGVVRAGLTGGESVAVIGQGVVGNLAIQLAATLGAGQTIAIDRNDWKLKKSAECGASATINSGDPLLARKSSDLTFGAGPHVVIEATGDPSAIKTACELCMEGGKVVILGSPRGLSNFDFYSTVHKKDLEVIGAHSSHIGLGYGGRASFEDSLKQVLSFIATKKIKVVPLVSQRVEWEKIPEFYTELLRNPGGYLGVIFDWSPAQQGTKPMQIASAQPSRNVASEDKKGRLGFAIVGCGWVAKVHAQALSQSQFGELVAVADVDESRARDFGNRYGVTWYTDLGKLLQDKRVSVVNVCTPPGSHEKIVEQAAAAKKHVLVEKPLELSLDSADRMISRCEKEGVRLGVVYQQRFRDSILRLQAAFSEGQFGKLFLGSFQDRSSRTKEYFEAAQWRSDVLVQFLGEGIHGLDLLQHFLGPIDNVSAFAAKRSSLPDGNQDTVVGTLTFAGGALATVEFTTSAYQGMNSRLELHGTEGSVIIEGGDIRYWKFQRPVVRLPSSPAPSLATRARRKAVREAKKRLRIREEASRPENQQSNWFVDHREVIDNFAGSILQGREPEVDGREARKSLEIVLALDESIRTGGPVHIGRPG